MGVGGQHAGGQVQPEATAWITSIHATEDDFDPKGGGVVLDDLRVLTCYHIIKNLDQKWVAFPNGRGGAHLIRRQVDHVVLPDSGSYGHLSDSYRDVYDLAILVLAKPVPVGVAPAPLFFPEPEELIGTRWWALGFPSGPLGGPAVGDVDSALTYGWVRLRRTSHDWVQEGFSGGGLWSPDYRGVVGIVGQAERASGNGQAITLYQADQWFPDQHLSSLAKRQYAPGQADPSPYPPEVVELADFLASLPDPLAIIHKVLDRTPAVAPQGATVLQLLAWMTASRWRCGGKRSGSFGSYASVLAPSVTSGCGG
jgi:hypothetical protein